MPRLRGAQEKVFVPIRGGSLALKYGFKMNKAQFASIGAILGIDVALGEAGVFFGANSPKPPRARLKTATATQSGFYDFVKADTLAKAGWELTSSPGKTAIRTDGKAVTVAVETPRGYMYAWNIAKADKALAISLGAEVPTDPDLLVWGSFPKPPRAVKRDASGSQGTFCPPTAAAVAAATAAGFSVQGVDGDWLN